MGKGLFCQSKSISHSLLMQKARHRLVMRDQKARTHLLKMDCVSFQPTGSSFLFADDGVFKMLKKDAAFAARMSPGQTRKCTTIYAIQMTA